MKKYQEETISTYNQVARYYQVKREKNAPMLEIDKFENLLIGKKVLDAGTGPGRDAEILAKKGFEVVGIDAADEFIKLATELVSEVSFRTMDIANLQFADNSFDGVWCCAVLSHFKREDLILALLELNRVLKPGGILFAAVKKGIGERVVLEAEFFNHPRFISQFSEIEFKQYLQDANFQVIDCYDYNERERFGINYRDIDFIFSFSRKNI